MTWVPPQLPSLRCLETSGSTSEKWFLKPASSRCFFIHNFTFMESAVLLPMAICNSIWYSTILTNKVVFVICLNGLLWAFVWGFFVHLFLWYHLYFLFCNFPSVEIMSLPITYCEHMGLAHLSLASIIINVIYGLCAICKLVFDIITIVLSYVQILHTVFHLPFHETQFKSLSTCDSRVVLNIAIYTPGLLFIYYLFFKFFMTHCLAKMSSTIVTYSQPIFML